MERYLGLVGAGETGLVIQPLVQADTTGWVAVSRPPVTPAMALPPDMTPGSLVWVESDTYLPVTLPGATHSLAALQTLLNLQTSLVAQQRHQLQDRATWLEEQYRPYQGQMAQWAHTQQAWQQHQTTLGQLRGELNSRRTLVRFLAEQIQNQEYLLQSQQYLVQYILAQTFPAPTGATFARETPTPAVPLEPLFEQIKQQAAQLQTHIDHLRTLHHPTSPPPDQYLRNLARHQQAYQNDQLRWHQLCRELTLLCQTGQQPAPPGWDWLQTQMQNYWQQAQTLYQQQQAHLQQEQADLQAQEARLVLSEQTAQELTQELAQHQATWQQNTQDYARWQATYTLQKELLDTLADRLQQAQTQVNELHSQAPVPQNLNSVGVAEWLLKALWGCLSAQWEPAAGAVVFLEGLSAEDSSIVLQTGTCATYQAGEPLIQANDLGQDLYVIQTGLVEVRAPQGNTIALLGPGRIVGEVAFITGARRTADVIALSPTQVVILGRSAMEQLVQYHPPVAAKVLLNLSRLVAERLGNG
ncbi:cAMP-binding protein [Gloeomargarita lithophora Alchichica-D10]|uniref:cAMP-binding protein n=1 Tax=Gloeomargarita lithophora Alchichica-D10 TaxID=1188229 RepID=A0A1J0AGX6_9CYAN|nr:cyclic nucleotide-binding domain-containing protein [Gloeomargarita lithophora]APB35181.1 cAMP-binding protein [Gloeomargarita lithophora Alchichica-D10]